MLSLEGSQQQDSDPTLSVTSDIISESLSSLSTPSVHKSDTFNVLSVTYAVEKVEKPMRELANSEATMSLAWLPEDSFSLATGTGTKWMRIYDLRGLFLISLSLSHIPILILFVFGSIFIDYCFICDDNICLAPYRAPTSVVAHTKAVYGVTFDPSHPHRLATFSDDSVIKIWDIRKLKDPVYLFVFSLFHSLALSLKMFQNLVLMFIFVIFQYQSNLNFIT